MKKIIKCKECEQTKKEKSKGLCTRCYDQSRYYAHIKPFIQQKTQYLKTIPPEELLKLVRKQ